MYAHVRNLSMFAGITGFMFLSHSIRIDPEQGWPRLGNWVLGLLGFLGKTQDPLG